MYQKNHPIFEPAIEEILSLPYDKFDQTQNSGWRIAAAQKKYETAANLIIEYLKITNNLDPYQVASLYFHAAQMYVYNQKKESAIDCLQKAILASESPDALVRWNDYVNATIAFLQRDRINLQNCKNSIENNGKIIHGIIPNLEIIQNMLANFDKSYPEIYEMPSNEIPRVALNTV